MTLKARDESRASSHAARLSKREREVLQGLARGGSYEEVARELQISINTIRAHVRTIYDKADACTRLEAVLWAARQGVIRLNEVA